MGSLGERIVENFTAMGDEEQVNCIHCGKRWYRIHYRDGVCHSCQQLRKPGRTAMAATRRQRFFIAVMIVAACLAALLSACM